MQPIRLLPALALLIALPSVTLSQDGFDAAKARYDECMQRLPLLMHTRGRQALAEQGSLRALRILVDSYPRAEEPVDRVQALIASFATTHCRGEEHVDLLDSWRRKYASKQHAWLWYRSLDVIELRKGPGYLREIVAKEKDVFLRVATLSALLEARRGDLYELLPGMLAKLPRRELERALTLETLVAGLHAMRRHLAKDEFKQAARALIQQLDEKKTPHRTKLVMARYLGDIFNSQSRSINAAPWLLQLEAGRNPKIDEHGYATTFFDIPASGDRICYVIDMSDSMLTPLALEITKRFRTTGSRTPEKKKKYDPFVEDYKIPWHQVKNRFDLARENIKLSLYKLPKTKHFCVVGFGDRAQLLEGCRGMMKATRRNITRVVSALDEVQPGGPAAMRPHGTLWGKTNLHGGLHTAFKLREKGLAGGYEYVDRKAFAEGCDTIYVLSDGDPTWDDWDKVDTNYGEDRVGDPESRTLTDGGDQLHYSGPYRDWKLIHDDVRRMNLFRKVEIHCIAIGEAQTRSLEPLARLGLGQTKRFGK